MITSSKQRLERVVVTVLAAGCVALWAYVIPSHLAVARAWQLLALPAALLAGGLVWFRYRARSADLEFAEMDVSSTERVLLTIGATALGAAAGVFLPFVMTRSLPRWTIALPLGTLLALVLGLIAWHHPALFFKNRRF
jgi:hypothetical protein